MKTKKDIQYDLKEIQGYFQDWNSPEETKAEINKVIVQLTRLFLKANDPTELYNLKDCVDFLCDFNMSIELVTPIETTDTEDYGNQDNYSRPIEEDTDYVLQSGT